MSLVPVREYTSAEEMMSAYRDRLRPKQPVVAIDPGRVTEPEPEPVIEPVSEPRRRDWIDVASPKAFKPAPTRVVLDVVSQATGISVAALLGDQRVASIIRPRQIACWIMRQETTRSLPQIGQAMGGRDHTTILNAIRRVDQIREQDEVFAALVDDIRDQVKARVAQ
ncbi:helix-turn-helix domain-containing protein [Bosea sp. NPDC055594]